MRRKSTRTTAKKAASPEKPAAATPRKSRRSSRRRKQSSTSEEEGSESEYQVQEQSIEDAKADNDSSDDDSKPLAALESNTRGRARKRHSSNKEEEGVEERVVITIRRRGRKGATPEGSHDDVSQDNEDDSNEYQVVQNSEMPAEVETAAPVPAAAADDEKKLKGKSKSRSKSKSEQQQQQAQQPSPTIANNANEQLTETISDNAQVTQQSPSVVDKIVENTDKCQNQDDDVSEQQVENSDKPSEPESLPESDVKAEESQLEIEKENSTEKIDENQLEKVDISKKIDIIENVSVVEKEEDNSVKNTDEEISSEKSEKPTEKMEISNESASKPDDTISLSKETQKDTFVSSYVTEESTNDTKRDRKSNQSRKKITLEITDDKHSQKEAEKIIEKPVKDEKQAEIQRSVSQVSEDGDIEQIMTPRRLLKLKRAISESQSESETTPLKRQKWDISTLESDNVVPKVDVEVLKEVLPKVEFLPEEELKLNPEEKVEKRRKTISESSDRFRKSSSDSEAPAKEFESNISEANVEDKESEDISNIIAVNRKISIVDDTASKLKPPPSPAKNPLSDVLFITNLVRPFTLKQLKELLERTGRIKEDGFWTDRIKSKCYVQYKSSEEAEATRNALHGVHWPIGNGKKLIIDYATEEDLEKAKNPPPPPVAAVAPIVAEKPIVDKENTEPERRVSEGNRRRSDDRKPSPPPPTRHVREWDLGKEEVLRKRSRSRSRSRERGRKVSRRSRSLSADYTSRKHRKAEEPVPQKMMDDLFLKTKATPSIYWQPLSPEEILQKQQQRLIRMEEHKRRMEETARSRAGGRDGRDGRMGRGGSYRRR